MSTETKDQNAKFRPDFITIPSQIAFDNTLAPLDIKLYGVIYWFERLKDGKCFASNKTLAKIVNSSSGGVANALVRLKRAGYIDTIFDKTTKQRKEIRCLILYRKSGVAYSDDEGGVNQMMNRDNNTKINKYKDSILSVYSLYLEKFKIDTHEWSYATPDERQQLLLAASKKYKLTPKRKEKIVARLQDAGVDQIKKAIINCSKSAWHQGDNDNNWSADLVEYLLRNFEMVEKWANKNEGGDGSY